MNVSSPFKRNLLAFAIVMNTACVTDVFAATQTFTGANGSSGAVVKAGESLVISRTGTDYPLPNILNVTGGKGGFSSAIAGAGGRGGSATAAFDVLPTPAIYKPSYDPNAPSNTAIGQVSAQGGQGGIAGLAGQSGNGGDASATLRMSGGDRDIRMLSASARAVGGAGGDGPTRSGGGGHGGQAEVKEIAVSAMDGADIQANATVQGGAGGSGGQTERGGTGASGNLLNAFKVSTSGSVALSGTARGGAGGNASRNGGAAGSAQIVQDLALTGPTGYMSFSAYGGDGGSSAPSSVAVQKGGNASVALSLTGAGSTNSRVFAKAYGGNGGGGGLQGAAGGDASGSLIISGTRPQTLQAETWQRAPFLLTNPSRPADATTIEAGSNVVEVYGGTGGSTNSGGIAGDGGRASLDKVYVSGAGERTAVTAYAQGGDGGTIYGKGTAGKGSGVALSNAVDGYAASGKLTLTQISVGGNGGASEYCWDCTSVWPAGEPGVAGIASSSLSKAVSDSSLELVSVAKGGDGGESRTGGSGTAGAAATAAALGRVTGLHDITQTVKVYGGAGGGGHKNGGAGGTAVVGASSVTADRGRASLSVEAVGGSGGGVTASAGRAGNGGSVSLVDVVSGQSHGELFLSQSAYGGHGGSKETSINDAKGGAAESRLKVGEALGDLHLQVRAAGGAGGEANARYGGSSGRGGDALAAAEGSALGAHKVVIEASAVGGSGGQGGGALLDRVFGRSETGDVTVSGLATGGNSSNISLNNAVGGATAGNLSLTQRASARRGDYNSYEGDMLAKGQGVSSALDVKTSSASLQLEASASDDSSWGRLATVATARGSNDRGDASVKASTVSHTSTSAFAKAESVAKATANAQAIGEYYSPNASAISMASGAVAQASSEASSYRASAKASVSAEGASVGAVARSKGGADASQAAELAGKASMVVTALPTVAEMSEVRAQDAAIDRALNEDTTTALGLISFDVPHQVRPLNCSGCTSSYQLNSIARSDFEYKALVFDAYGLNGWGDALESVHLQVKSDKTTLYDLKLTSREQVAAFFARPSRYLSLVDYVGGPVSAVSELNLSMSLNFYADKSGGLSGKFAVLGLQAPLPASSWLLLSALGGLGVARRRMAQQSA